MPLSPSSANQYFAVPRFGRLFSRHSAEHLPGYGMAAAVLAGLLLLLMGFTAYQNEGSIPINGQMAFYTFFLVMAGIIFTSGVFGQFGDKRQATLGLTLPASHLEKYLVAWLYSLPLFILVFTLVFYAVDAAVLYAGARAGRQPELLNIFDKSLGLGSLLWSLALLHGVWLLGAIYFEKTHFIKTGFAVSLLLGVLSVVNFQALRLLFGPGLQVVPPFAKPILEEAGQGYQLSVGTGLDWLALVPAALAGLLWLAAYFRLTEKQL